MRMANEEQARIGAATFDGHPLTKKIIFAACVMSEFEKIMNIEEELKNVEHANLLDLRSPV